MSFDIWLDCFKKGEPAPFKRELFESIFLPFCSNRDEYQSAPDFMQVEYPDGGRGDIYLSNLNNEVLAEARAEAGGKMIPPEKIDEVLERAKADSAFIQHVMFNHCGGDAFFEDMYRLAKHTNSIIHWPDAEPVYVYTDESALGELPTEYFEDAKAIFVRSGDDIVKAIENS
jgi:hypothetical protein